LGFVFIVGLPAILIIFTMIYKLVVLVVEKESNNTKQKISQTQLLRNTMNNFSITITSALLFLSTALMANEAKQSNDTMEKTLTVKLVHLQDNQGLKYVGGIVHKKDLQPYLAQMKQQLTADFSGYRQNQVNRDHGEFHMTLINPYEYKEIDHNKITLGENITITFKGLARVSEEKKAAYFVVVQSSEAQLHRKQLGLKVKDFHVTLGFKPQDVYGVSKGTERLIN